MLELKSQLHYQYRLNEKQVYLVVNVVEQEIIIKGQKFSIYRIIFTSPIILHNATPNMLEVLCGCNSESSMETKKPAYAPDIYLLPMQTLYVVDKKISQFSRIKVKMREFEVQEEI